HEYVQIKKTGAGQGREAIVAALSVDRRLKHVVVVDEDINVFDDAEVLWAVATRSRRDRDILVLPNMASTTRDPTAYASGSSELAYHSYTDAKGRAEGLYRRHAREDSARRLKEKVWPARCVWSVPVAIRNFSSRRNSSG